MFTTASDMRNWVRKQKKSGRKVALVPTMVGCRHGTPSHFTRAQANNNNCAAHGVHFAWVTLPVCLVPCALCRFAHTDKRASVPRVILAPER